MASNPIKKKLRETAAPADSPVVTPAIDSTIVPVVDPTTVLGIDFVPESPSGMVQTPPTTNPVFIKYGFKEQLVGVEEAAFLLILDGNINTGKSDGLLNVDKIEIKNATNDIFGIFTV